MADSRSAARNHAIFSPLNLFLLGVLGLVGLVYTWIGFSTQDWSWFWPIFNQQPTQIIIHCYGQDLPLEPNSPDFLPLTYLVNQQLSAEKRVDDDFISDENYRILRQRETTISIEMRFEQHPIRIHSNRSYFSNLDTLLVVLGGDESDDLFVYGARQGQPTPGLIRIVGGQKVSKYLLQHEMCMKPRKE
jgi:hypothetical protein